MPTRSPHRISPNHASGTARARAVPRLLLMGALVAAGAAQMGTGDLAAQEAEAAVPDTTVVTLPAHEETTLSNGTRVIVVPAPEAAATTWTLLVPGGSAADAPGKEGTAALLAAIMESVGRDDPGMALGVTASADALAVTLVDSTGSPGAASRRLGDALRRVVVSDSAVDAVRAERRAVVVEALRRLDVVAGRTLTRAVYGDHPYGRPETPATLDAVTAADVSAWRDTHLRPDGAVLAVTGPVSPDAVMPVLEAGLEGWEAGEGALPEPAAQPLPDGATPRRVLLHQPGLGQAVVTLGAPLPPAGDDDWTALAVLDRALTARPDEPLVTVRPSGAEEGVVAGTGTAAQRRRGPGIFQAQAVVDAGVATVVARGLLDGLAAAGTDFLPPAAIRPAQRELAGSFRAQVGRPEAAAALLAVNRILGLPDSVMATYPARVGRAGPQELREVAAAYLAPESMSVVVVADARLVREELEEALGPFELRDAVGAPLAVEALGTLTPLPPLDASMLEPMTLEYRIVAAEQTLGTVRRVLEPGPDSLPGTFRFRSRADLGGQQVSQSVLFTTPGFRPVAASSSITAGGETGGMSVTVADGRVTGTLTAGGGASRPLDAEMPEGGVFGDMLELSAWLAALQLPAPDPEGGPAPAYTLPVVAPESGRVSSITLQVGGVEEVTVPAGTFRARRVEVGGARPQTFWISEDEPRVPVRLVPEGRPASIELVSVEGPSGG